MDEDRSAWLDGRLTWDRVQAWLEGSPGNHPNRGDAAVGALGDIRQLRWLLDQAELVAVRTARQAGKPWAEIATRLGVSRQSAWEKWRELEASPGTRAEHTDLDPVAALAAAAAADLVEQATRGRSALRDEVIDRAARRRRRSGSVVVPNVVGLLWPDAVDVLLARGLVGVGPDGPASLNLISTAVRVVDQTPEAGAKVPANTAVTLWTQRGGGTGVREPRRPKPKPLAGREIRDAADEAIG